MAPPAGGSALRGRYLVRDPFWNAALRVRERVLRAALRPARTELPASWRRIVLGIGGHAGDAIIASSVLPLLRQAAPDATIGIAAPSWCQAVLAGHPAVSHWHRVDHWKVSRAPAAIGSRWMEYRRTRRRAVRELRDAGYDVAVDLYPFFPGMADLFWRAGVPVRVGFESGGGAPWLTHPLPWTDTAPHTAEQHRVLLQAWEPPEGWPAPRYDLPPLSAEDTSAGERLITEAALEPRGYAVLHMGTGNPRKEWPPEAWHSLATELRRRGIPIVFTGHGSRDEAAIARMVRAGVSATNLCGRTTWATLRHVLGRARFVIGSDSAAMHLAAAEAVPCITLMAGMSDVRHWRPLGALATPLTHGVPCAPCFRSQGCATMLCVRGVTVDRVLAQVDALGGGGGAS